MKKLDAVIEILKIVEQIDEPSQAKETAPTGKEPLKWGECSDEPMNWEDAKKWCAERGGRLPTAPELLQAYLDGVPGFTASNYWSGSPSPAVPAYAYYINFVNGYMDRNPVASAYYVRCVS